MGEVNGPVTKTHGVGQESGVYARFETPAAPPTRSAAVDELRNLLYMISACAGAATEEALPGSDAAASLADIVGAAARAMGLVESLAAERFAGSGASNVNGVLADFLPILRRQAGSRARVVLEAHEKDLPATIDPHSLEHILLNLVVNAVDAVEHMGVVTVTTRTVEDAVRITVTDTGTGMDAATLARAFDPRFTTRAHMGRRGLGLATVRRLVEEAGGRVSLVSSPGRGTEVRIDLRAPMS